jgi:hypothetical protein
MYIIIIIGMNVVDNLNMYEFKMYEFKMHEFTSSDHPPQ